ncbi:MAG: flagellar biosynthesis protein FlhF [Thermotogaceae bacterium]|jgi:flagellar biosynthesis protein FlhF|nr:flagellar biosynthesis protein FlhF [Thermotogaceae bacterium]
MKIKKYVVDDVKTALKRIKNELGEDAVILQTRKFKKGGFLGIGSSVKYEVTAVADDKEKRNDSKKQESKNEYDGWVDSKKLYELKKILSQNSMIKNEKVQQTTNPVNKRNDYNPSIPEIDYQYPAKRVNNQNYYPEKSWNTMNSHSKTREETSGVSVTEHKSINEMKKEMLSMKRLMQDLSLKMDKESYLPGIPEEYKKIYKALKKHELNDDIARKIVESLRIVTQDKNFSTLDFEKKFVDILHPIIKTDNPLKEYDKGDIIFFVGPTGVGKTTTLTKIAAMLSLEMRKKVGILTIDTYRIAAVDQLKTSADIMGIEVGVAYNPGELRSMLEKFVNYDLILVDTAGRSQKNEMQMSELTRYLQIVNPKYIFLTESMNVRKDDLFDIIEQFSVVSPTHIILTKSDETSYYGSIVEITNNYDIPVAFVTNGQRIPEDIMVADSKRLASIIVKEVLKNARSN